jgi:hypothetical protein
MKKTSEIHPWLQRLAGIARMERGKLCRMTGRPHYNHQTWQDGRNVSRYVPREDVAALQEAIDGYRRFMQLAQAYADEVIRRTREERLKAAATRKRSKRQRRPRP